MTRYNQETFIEKAKIKHNNFYSYDNTNYIHSRTKILITCPSHGDFLQTPSEHLNGSGCTKCKHEKAAKDNKDDINSFIDKANKKFNNLYEYHNTVYINSSTAIIVTCKKHGDFEVNPHTHINNRKSGGCQKCSYERRFSSTEDFISKSKLIHKDFYNYSKVKYVTAKTEVEIICPYHGIFFQKPTVHLLGCGCGQCSKNVISKPMSEIIDFIKNKYPEFEIIIEHRFEDCRNIHTLPFDLYIPKMNFIIEYDGRHHYESIPSWGGDEYLLKVKENDQIKTNYCKDNNITLLRISYTEDHLSVLQNFIQNLER